MDQTQVKYLFEKIKKYLVESSFFNFRYVYIKLIYYIFKNAYFNNGTIKNMHSEVFQPRF